MVTKGVFCYSHLFILAEGKFWHVLVIIHYEPANVGTGAEIGNSQYTLLCCLPFSIEAHCVELSNMTSFIRQTKRRLLFRWNSPEQVTLLTKGPM